MYDCMLGFQSAIVSNPALAALPVFGISFLTSLLIAPGIISRLLSSGIVGTDVNKKKKTQVAEMGGIILMAGFMAGSLLSVALYAFLGLDMGIVFVLAGLLTVVITAFIGVFDDLLDMSQSVKAVLPLFAALPLVAIRTGETVMALPFIGPVEFGLVYVIVLVPLGVTVASNLTNMLAGFNGMEVGMGSVACLALAIFAVLQMGFNPHATEALLLSASMLGALLAFLPYNWFPAKVFPGDIGTLSIGALIASVSIIGNMEAAAALLVLPHALDFGIKVYNGFPSSGWWGILRNGKLYSPEKKVGLAQYVMHAADGISEQNLVIVFVAAEAVMAVVSAILLYSYAF